MFLQSFVLILSRTDSDKLSESRNNAIPECSKRGIDGASVDDISCGPSGRSEANEGLSDIAKIKKRKRQKSQNSDKKRKRKRDDSQNNDKRKKRRKKETFEVRYS